MIRAGKINIIYPGTPEAEAWAAALEKEIRTFRIPGAVRRKTGLRSAAYTGEPWLVVLCSPETPGDPEIIRAVDGYIREGRRNRILTMLTAGEPAESFPDALLRETLPDGQEIEHEPLAANISAPTRRESRKRLKVEKLRILAPILGVTFDELRNRRHRRQMQILLAAGGAAVIGAAAFLAYAAGRSMVISGQNREISAQYARAEEERQEAVRQRNAAREKLAETVALRIRDLKDDNELAALLCLEFLPEYGLDCALPELLKDSLEQLCGPGYVPVTSRYAYARTRGIEGEKKEDLKADTEEKPAGLIELTLPEEENRFATAEFTLRSWSPAYRYAVYNGGGEPTLYTWIRFLDEPEKSYFLRDGNGDYCQLRNTVCLDDGTLIGGAWKYINGHRYSCCRYDPFEKQYLPFRAGSPAPAESGQELPEEWISRFADEDGVEGFVTADGLPVIFGYVRYEAPDPKAKGGYLRIYDRATLETLGSLEDAQDIRDIPGTDMILVRKTETFLVCRKDPFEPLYETEKEYTDAGSFGTCSAVCYGDGTGYLVCRYSEDGAVGAAVCDLYTGKRLCLIREPGMSYGMILTGDGKLMNSVNYVPMLWDLKTGELFATVPGRDPSPEAYGPLDGASGLRTSAAVYCSTVWEYREEAVPVPEDLEGRIALARELLNGRVLTEEERRAYHLNRR